MRLDVQDSDHPDPVIEPGALPEVRDLPFDAVSPGFGWLRLYSRPAGIIQMLYAAFFGCLAYGRFSTGRFHSPETFFKIHQPEIFDYQWFITITLCTLLSLSGFIGGYGLLRLRPSVRRWEVAYLGFIAVGAAAYTVWIQSDAPGSPDYLARADPPAYTALILFTMAFALPFAPFLFGAPGATLLRASAKKKPLRASDGVSDRELDG